MTTPTRPPGPNGGNTWAGPIGGPNPAPVPPDDLNPAMLNEELGWPGNVKVWYSTRGQMEWAPKWSDPNRLLQFPESVQVYDVMTRTDDQVDAVMRAVTLPIMDAPWTLDDKGCRPGVGDFIRSEIGLSKPGDAPANRRRHQAGIMFHEHLKEALDCLAYGFMPFEQVYSTTFPGDPGHPDIPALAQQPTIHLRKLAQRPPATIRRIRLDQDGGLVSLFQLPIPGEPYWQLTADGEIGVEIPVNRLVVYVTDKKGADWSGVSILRTAYRPWKIKEQLCRLDAIAAERNSLGLPLVEYDPALMTQDAALELATQARSGAEAGVAVPVGVRFSLVGVSGQVPDLGPKIDRYNEAIGRASLAMFLNLGHDNGARSLGDTFLSFFTRSLQGIAGRIGDTFSEHVIRDLVEWNFGPDEAYPRLVPGEITTEMALAPDALQKLIASNVIVPDDELEASLRRRYRLPEADTKSARVPASPAIRGPFQPEVDPGVPNAPAVPRLPRGVQDPGGAITPTGPSGTTPPGGAPAGPAKPANPFQPVAAGGVASLAGYAAFLAGQVASHTETYDGPAEPTGEEFAQGRDYHGRWSSGGSGSGANISVHGKPTGKGTPDDPVQVNGDIDLAVHLLGKGKHVRLRQPDEVATVLTKLSAVVDDAKKKGKDAPTYNLCKVSVPKTNLFCAESKGIPRAQMPQLSGKAREGTPAWKDRDAKGKVNAGPAFQKSLVDHGIPVHAETVQASHLRASQSELDGAKVAGMYASMKAGKLKDAPIFVTKDNYIVDGHHRWAAKAALELEQGARDVTMPVNVVDLDIGATLDFAHEFTTSYGIQAKGLGGAADALRAAIMATVLAFRQQGLPGAEAEFDEALAQARDYHGRWTSGGVGGPGPSAGKGGAGGGAGGAAPGGAGGGGAGGSGGVGGKIKLDADTVKDMRANPQSTAAKHLVTDSDGTVHFTSEREALHDKIVAEHLAGVAPSANPTLNMLGGGPAAGKSTLVDKGPFEELRGKNSVMVNADDIKGKLPEYVQGTKVKDPAAAAKAHEESSYLAKRVQAAALERGLPVTLDGTGDGSEKGLRKKIDAAHAAGYKVNGYYVTVPTDVAVDRAMTRGARTGRVVPETTIRATHISVSKLLPTMYGEFDSMALFDTSGGMGSLLKVASSTAGGKLDVADQAAWGRFVAKGNESAG